MNIERPSEDWKDYQLIDSGGFEKLERFGRYTMIRPEPKALWDKALPAADWKRRAQTAFTPGAGFSKAGKEDSGVWTMLGRMQEQWNISYRLPAVDVGALREDTASGMSAETAQYGPAIDISTSGTALIDGADAVSAGILSEFSGAELHLRLGLTAFKHVGVFPEQAPNWDFIYRQVARLRANNAKMGETRPPRVLNLFAYTGAASLAARLDYRRRPQICHPPGPSRSLVRRHHSRSSRLRTRPGRGEVETGRMPERYPKRMCADSRTDEQLPGAESLFQRLFCDAGGHPRGLRLRTGRPPYFRRAGAARRLRTHPAPERLHPPGAVSEGL